MNERFSADLMLARVPKDKDKVEGAYNRALHLERRRELAQEWADFVVFAGCWDHVLSAAWPWRHPEPRAHQLG